MLITHPLGLLNYVSFSFRLDLKIVLTFDVQTARHFLLNFALVGLVLLYSSFKWHLFY